MTLKMKFGRWSPARRALAVAAVLAMISTAAFAAGEGRMIGKVLDGDGKPVEGVDVTVTSPDLTSFYVTKTTKKNGSFVVAFADAFMNYSYKFEKDGYQTSTVEYKSSSSGTIRREFTIYAGVPVDTEGGVAEIASASNEAILAFNEALDAYNNDDLETAAAKLNATLAADPEVHQAHLLLSEIYASQRKYTEAAQAAEAALALVPANVDGLRLRYQAYRSSGDKEKADEAFAAFKAAGEAAEEAKRVYNEGVALDKAGDGEGAYQKFLQAVEMDPNLSLAQTAIMAMAFKTERYEDSAKAAEQILVNSPGDEQALRVRFDSYEKLGDKENRLDALLGLASVDPDFALGTLLNEAAALFNNGDYTTSKPMFEKIISVDANHAKVYYFLGLIAVNDGDNATAKQHLAKFVELDPEDPEAGTAKEMIGYL